MKKLISNVASVNFALLLSLFLLVSFNASANNGGDKPAKANVELRYIGHIDNNPVIEITFNNSKETVYSLIFKDDKGTILYSDKVRLAKGSKKYALNADELGYNTLSIEVKNRSNNIGEVFTVNRSRSVIEETLVAKVK